MHASVYFIGVDDMNLDSDTVIWRRFKLRCFGLNSWHLFVWRTDSCWIWKKKILLCELWCDTWITVLDSVIALWKIVHQRLLKRVVLFLSFIGHYQYEKRSFNDAILKKNIRHIFVEVMILNVCKLSVHDLKRFIFYKWQMMRRKYFPNSLSVFFFPIHQSSFESLSWNDVSIFFLLSKFQRRRLEPKFNQDI